MITPNGLNVKRDRCHEFQNLHQEYKQKVREERKEIVKFKISLFRF